MGQKSLDLYITYGTSLNEPSWRLGTENCLATTYFSSSFKTEIMQVFVNHKVSTIKNKETKQNDLRSV